MYDINSGVLSETEVALTAALCNERCQARTSSDSHAPAEDLMPARFFGEVSETLDKSAVTEAVANSKNTMWELQPTGPSLEPLHKTA